MRIQDIMSKDVVHIDPDTGISAAKELLRVREIDHLVVLKDKRVVGVVSQRDIAAAPDDEEVRNIMSNSVVTIDPAATIRRAAGVMRGRAVGCLPVVEDEKLVGIVTRSDLLTALSRGEIHEAPPTERRVLRKRGPRKRSPYA